MRWAADGTFSSALARPRGADRAHHGGLLDPVQLPRESSRRWSRRASRRDSERGGAIEVPRRPSSRRAIAPRSRALVRCGVNHPASVLVLDGSLKFVELATNAVNSASIARIAMSASPPRPSQAASAIRAGDPPCSSRSPHRSRAVATAARPGRRSPLPTTTARSAPSPPVWTITAPATPIGSRCNPSTASCRAHSDRPASSSAPMSRGTRPVFPQQLRIE